METSANLPKTGNSWQSCGQLHDWTSWKLEKCANLHNFGCKVTTRSVLFRLWLLQDYAFNKDKMVRTTLIFYFYNSGLIHLYSTYSNVPFLILCPSALWNLWSFGHLCAFRLLFKIAALINAKYLLFLTNVFSTYFIMNRQSYVNLLQFGRNKIVWGMGFIVLNKIFRLICKLINSKSWELKQLNWGPLWVKGTLCIVFSFCKPQSQCHNPAIAILTKPWWEQPPPPPPSSFFWKKIVGRPKCVPKSLFQTSTNHFW
jgi:hypothetical protein